MGDAEAAFVTARVVEDIGAIDAGAWDACAGSVNPFVSHAFLRALEDSGSVSAETGWAPQHLALEAADGTVAAVMPLYLKNHSYGEYVFDHAWAHAYERAGGRYYPKLQSAVPFTPVTGPRLMVRPDMPAGDASRGLIAAALQVAERHKVSSFHVTFPEEAEARRLGEFGLLLRNGEQFHWENRGYARFDDFLDDLASRKRKAIRKERREAQDPSFTFETLTGAGIREEHWDAFFHFYIDTGNRKWGTPYLNRTFFSLLGERLGDRVVLMLVSRGGRPIAGALNLAGTEALYGRYWGAVEDHRFLHFETCYYRAIDYAIEHRLARVEAGAQGPHKLARGYVPVKTWSAHWLRDPGFHEAVERFLTAERREVEAEISYLGEHSPFRKGGNQGSGQ
ncbi:GNAT family N-acetyltransferase [Oceanibacterium hippocampi]|uniref:FemAB family protein n=1 Tax=Oceanibacterium hippocampi TaxID=745714 RepID=A0A1Y5SRR6_9PROT|nr:GNAT family N-acetyltransferase [Oceanibacterium hippocampi]SLN43700.1 hypothetical protein OCH7691_01828 [Oceanibacterium hippocampi]